VLIGKRHDADAERRFASNVHAAGGHCHHSIASRHADANRKTSRRRRPVTRSLFSIATGLTMTAHMAVPVLGQADDPVTLPTGEMDAAERDRIDAAIVDLLERNPELPAMYIGIWDPERGAYTAAYGTADLDSGRAPSVDDHLRIGSVSKTFTGAVILQLVDEGLVELDATIEETAPELASRFPEVADRTIAQLLTMSSGIPDYANVPDGVISGVGETPTRVWEADELIQAGIDGGLSEPGTSGYSTTNYILLQEIAEEITGTSLNDLITERVTGPLALDAHGREIPAREWLGQRLSLIHI
jgi:D-alanyl-D-alanine carboxypeptidase